MGKNDNFEDQLAFEIRRGHSPLDFRVLSGDAFAGSFSDIIILLSEGKLNKISLDQQAQAAIFIPGPSSKIVCAGILKAE